MCDYCLDVQLVKNISSPLMYQKIITYIKDLVEIDGFVLTDSNCELGNHKNSGGEWVDDIISHTIKCPKCGQEFTCSVNTYHGGGSFKRN